MPESSIDTQKRTLAELERQLQALGPLMRGSVTHMGSRHKQPYLSVSIKGKTRVIYLGEERAVAAKQWTDNYRRAMNLIDEISLIRMQLLKAKPTKGPRP